MTLREQHSFWVDSHYQGDDGKAKVMGGLLGDLLLAGDQPLPPPWSHLLVLGQYLGIGQRRGFGWGRYQLVTRDNRVTCQRQLAARSLLEPSCEPVNLLSAWRHKQSKTAKNEPDHDQGWEEAPPATIGDARPPGDYANSGTVAIGERQHQGIFVCLSGAPAVVKTAQGRLQAERDDQTLVNIPWRGLRAVLLLGRHHITSPAMHAAMEYGVPLHFGSRGGEYRGVLCNARPQRGPRLWRLQQERGDDPQACLAVAKSLMDSRLRHQREVLRQRGLSGGAELSRGRQQIAACDSLQRLLGIEGRASQRYFSALAEGLDEQWGFTGRNRRPPKDPFNALLSLGYTLLHAHAKTMLIIDGLDPWMGFYHQSHGAHCTLASDMMEPFRHLVERVALSFLASGGTGLEDFNQAEDGACYLSARARQRYLTRLSERFEQRVNGHDGRNGNLLALLSAQNQSLIAFIRARESFHAWVQR